MKNVFYFIFIFIFCFSWLVCFASFFIKFWKRPLLRKTVPKKPLLPQKCWKWCLMMLQKNQCLFEKKTFFYLNEQSKSFFLYFFAFFFAKICHQNDFFCERNFHQSSVKKSCFLKNHLKKITCFDKGLKIVLALACTVILIPNPSSKKTFFIYGRNVFFCSDTMKTNKLNLNQNGELQFNKNTQKVREGTKCRTQKCGRSERTL